MPPERFYAGIGSRETPVSLAETIRKIAVVLEEYHFVLRSGGAPGADTFFEQANTNSDIYLPWPGFNDRPLKGVTKARYIKGPTEEALDLAFQEVKGFEHRKRSVQSLLARNMHQILGGDLQTPVEFVVCWTPGARMQGGTAHAMRLAKSMGIPIFNLASPTAKQELWAKIKQTALFERHI